MLQYIIVFMDICAFEFLESSMSKFIIHIHALSFANLHFF